MTEQARENAFAVVISGPSGVGKTTLEQRLIEADDRLVTSISTIVAVFVAVLGLTAAWTFIQAPIYKSTAIIEIQPQARRVLAGGDMSGLGAAGFGWFAEESIRCGRGEFSETAEAPQYADGGKAVVVGGFDVVFAVANHQRVCIYVLVADQVLQLYGFAAADLRRRGSLHG